MNATEDNPISVYLSAHSIASSIEMSNEFTIRITKFPTGSTFSIGYLSGNVWILTHTDFGEIQLQLPEHSSGNYEITAEALYIGTSHGRVGTVQFMVQAIADAPSLDVTHSSCIESGRASFIVRSSLVDSDGSETLLVTITNLPSGSLLSAGRVNEEGEYILDPADLQGSVTVTLPPSWVSSNISIVFIATATEAVDNSTDSTNTTISLMECPKSNILTIKVIMIMYFYLYITL